MQDAVVIITGHVTAIQGYWEPRQADIFTNVTVRVEEVLRGDLQLEEITIKQQGGTVGDLHSWVVGSPKFVLGEKVLLFLRPNQDGSLRVAHLYQGKFKIVFDPDSGEQVTYRETPAGVQVITPPTSQGTGAVPPDGVHLLRELKRRIRSHLQMAPKSRNQELPILNPVPGVPLDTTLSSFQDEFTFLGPARWFEPDAELPIVMKINAAGEPLAPTSGFDQVRQSLQAWSSVSGSSLRYQDGGFTSSVGRQYDGVNAVSFRDPLNAMDPPVNCTGTLAVGGFTSSARETRTVNGTTFHRILDGDLVFNDGWEGCGFYENFANFAEVATHELGHVLGLGHSSDPTATMYYMAHFDGRGAALRQDDMDGLRKIYPASQVVTTTAPTHVTAGSAVLTGTSTPNGTATTGWFLWGTTNPPTTQTPSQGLGSGTSSVPYSQLLTGLAPSTTYYVQAVAQGNGAPVYGGVLSFTTPPWTSGPSDFNGDGKADLLWQHQSTGAVIVWYMDGPTMLDAKYLYQGGLPDWKVVGSRDFNGDGKADLLWQHQSTGAVIVWYMDGPTMLDAKYLYPGGLPDWKVVGSDDFNGDGKSDLLWHNAITGDVFVWFMDGTTLLAATPVYRGADLAWRIVGTGDFNGDGKTDILWHNATTGDVYVWFMDGATLATATPLYRGADLAWRLVGVGDFNSDGKPDLLWQHQTTGAVIVWYMDGTTMLDAKYVYAGGLPDWKVVGPK